MKIKTTIVTMLIATYVYTMQPCSAVEYKGLSEKIGLRILYAGHSGTAREKDFVDFLSAYFKEVKTADLAQFIENNKLEGKGPLIKKELSDRSDGFDVIILDYDSDGAKMPQVKLPESYTRATVTLGLTGALLCRNLKLKTGYL